MELMNILSPSKKEIISKKVFFCSNLSLIAIKDINNIESNTNDYSVLFLAKQESTDEAIFISCNIVLSDIEVKILHSYQYYIGNIIKDDESLKAYEKIISNITNRNIFFTDFRFTNTDLFNFSFISYRKEDEHHCTSNEIMISAKEYIKINLIFQSLFKISNINFVINMANSISSLKFIKPEEINIRCSYYDDNTLCTAYRIREKALNFDINFKVFNIEIDTNKYRLNNPIVKKYYDKEYPNSVDCINIYHVIPYIDDSILILFFGYPKYLDIITKTFKQEKTYNQYGIIIEKDKLKETNFIDYKNKILSEVK